MTKYKYTAVNLDKKKFTGTFLAEDVKQLKALLAQQNLFLISAKPVSQKSPNPFFSVSGKVSARELTSFCRQFCAMINAGIAIIDCLEILRTQSFSSFFKKVLEMVYEDVKTGVLLSDAMKKHPRVFPHLFVSMVYVGEVSGSIDVVMQNLADYYEQDDQIRKKVKSAMIYPIVMMVMIIGVLLLMMFFVVPTFKDALSTIDVPLPALTVAIFNLSEFLKKYWQVLLVSFIVIALALVIFFRTQVGKRTWDTLKIKLPVISTVTINMISSRFTRDFSLLIGSGMDLIEAMEAIEKVLDNRNIQARFKLAIEDVKNGTKIAIALENQKIFPPILTQMIAIGEHTGKVDEILQNSCSFFDEQVDSAVNAVTTVLQPILLMMLGAVVATMFIAVYAPMLSIMENLV